jgi:ribulose-phosphate 3-epimerase
MAEIVPAILARDYNDLRNKLSRVVSFVRIVQIDMCDGFFTKSVSWPYNELKVGGENIQSILNEEEGLPYWDKIDFEFDLMVKNAHENLDFFVRLGAKRLVFHLEAEGDLETFSQFLEGLDMYTRENIEIGLAINTNTNISILDNFISKIDFIQFMGIKNIGYQGEPFDENVLEQIKNIRLKYPEILTSVDGSVNEETAKVLVDLGVDRLVIGSALFNSFDIEEKIKEFESY